MMKFVECRCLISEKLSRYRPYSIGEHCHGRACDEYCVKISWNLNEISMQFSLKPALKFSWHAKLPITEKYESRSIILLFIFFRCLIVMSVEDIENQTSVIFEHD